MAAGRSKVGTNTFLLRLQFNVMKVPESGRCCHVSWGLQERKVRRSCDFLEETLSPCLNFIDLIALAAVVLGFLASSVCMSQCKTQSLWDENVINRMPSPFHI